MDIRIKNINKEEWGFEIYFYFNNNEYNFVYEKSGELIASVRDTHWRQWSIIQEFDPEWDDLIDLDYYFREACSETRLLLLYL